MFEEWIDLLAATPTQIRERLKSGLQSELERLVERGLIDSAESDELKARFISELQQRVLLGSSMARGAGSQIGSWLRETLDIPSRSELRELMEGLERSLTRLDAELQGFSGPIHNPATLARPSELTEILPSISTWSRFDAQRGIYFNSYALDLSQKILIDPLDPTPADSASIDPRELEHQRHDFLKSLGTVDLIVLTNRDHRRAAEWFAKETGAPIAAAHNEDFGELPISRRLRDDEDLIPGVRVLAMPGKTPGEIALLRTEDSAQLFLGDALVGDPAAQLRTVPEPKIQDLKLLRRSLRRLIDEDFDALLLCDGVSLLAEAGPFVSNFLRAL